MMKVNCLWQVLLNGLVMTGELPSEYKGIDPDEVRLLINDEVKIRLLTNGNKSYHFIRHFHSFGIDSETLRDEYHLGMKGIHLCYDQTSGEIRCSGEMIV